MSAPTVILDIDLTPQPNGYFAYYEPNTTVTDPTEGLTLTQNPLTVVFNGTLQSPVLYATDNANMSPSGWAYGLSFSQNPLVPGNPAPLTNFQVPVGPLAYTATNAAPCVITPAYSAAFGSAFNNLGVPNGTGVQFLTGAPAGFSDNITYYVVNQSATTLQLAATRGGSAIASTSTGSGNLQVTRYAYSGLAPLSQAPVVSPYLTASGNLAGVNPAQALSNLGIPGALGASGVTQAMNLGFLSAGTVYNANVNDLACANCTTGNTTVKLPSAPVNGSIVGVKLILQNTPSGNTGLYYVTVNTQGSDTFEVSGGSTSASLFLLNESATWQYNATAKIWVRQWGTLPWSQIQHNMPKVYNVVSYGADPTGANDSTTAVQAAVNAATGSANPATTARTPVAAVYLPSGTYKISTDIIIRSVAGFRLIGDGPDNTTLSASGTGFSQAVLFIDGSLDGIFEGFAMQGNGTEQVTDGIRLDWTTAAFRSTSGNCFRDIRMRALNAVVYLSLEGNGTRQLDGTTLENISLSGGQVVNSWSSSGNYQVGFAFGNGSYGNNYNHCGVGLSASGFYYGYKINVSSLSFSGGQPYGNFCDFYVQPGAQCTFTNIQSQQCNQFLTAPSAFSPIPVTFGDILVKTSYLNAGSVLCSVNGGVWQFKNFSAPTLQTGGSGSYVLGTFNLSGAFSTRQALITFDNLIMAGTRASCIVPGSYPIEVAIRNYGNYAPSTGLYATPVPGDLSSVYTGGAWVNQDASQTLTGTPTAPTAAGGTNTTQVATTAFVQAALSTGITSVSDVQASDLGMTAWTVNPVFSNATILYATATYAGRLLFWTFRVPVSGTINTINYVVDVIGSGLSNAYLGIYSMAGSLLGSCSTDQSTNMGATGVKAAALSSGLAVTGGSLYRVGLVIGAASAFPTLISAGSNLSGSYANAVLSASNYMSGFYGSAGTYTALPGSITPSGAGVLAEMPVFIMD